MSIAANDSVEPCQRLLNRITMKIITSSIMSLLLLAVCGLTAAQVQSNPPFILGKNYSNTSLGFRYTPPQGMRDKTEQYKLQAQGQSKASSTTRPLSALLVMSSGPDSNAANWGSVTIETYPRKAVAVTDDNKAAAQMNAWVAHSKDASVLPKSVVISGQTFTVSLFGLQEGPIKKGATVWTTIRKGKLLSFAFAANSPQQLQELTETMKTLQFF